ncbi:MAG: MlaD family protein [bacterium]|nr:MlaD family protein [bacterium]
MAIAHSDKVKAIVFLVVTISLFITLILVLVGSDWMEKTDSYYIDFNEIKGIAPGSQVRYNGVAIGKVKRIRSLSNISKARVTVEVQQNIPIKNDSTATLGMDSLIVGNRFIQITPGSPGAVVIKPNDQSYIIRGERSMLDNMFLQAAEISSRSSVLISNVNNIFSPENSRAISSILLQFDSILKHDATNATAEFRQTLADVRIAINAAQIKDTMADMRGTLISVRRAVDSANDMMSQNQTTVNDTLNSIRAATDSLNELLINLNRHPLIRGKGEKTKEWINE